MSSSPPLPPLQPSISPTRMSSNTTRTTRANRDNPTDSISHVLSQALESMHHQPDSQTQTSRHGVAPSVAKTCREEYKAVLHAVKRSQNVSLLNAFLENQSKQVTDAVNHRSVGVGSVGCVGCVGDVGSVGSDEDDSDTDNTDITAREPVTICTDLFTTRTTSRHIVTLQPTSAHSVQLFSIGRMDHNEVVVPTRYNHVSRTHCLVMVAILQTGPMVFVVDMWSKYGTGLYPPNVSPTDPVISTVASTKLPEGFVYEHLSIPGQYAVLSAPLSLHQPTPVFALGVSQDEAPPLRLTFQLQPIIPPEPLPVTSTCLICMEAPRTEVFQSCQHLVGCAACVQQLLLANHPKCPVCRQPVKKESIRKVRASDGGENTFVGYSLDRIDEHGEHEDCEEDDEREGVSEENPR